jgi:hypothetical protein
MVGTWLPVAAFVLGVALLVGRFTIWGKLGGVGRAFFALGFVLLISCVVAYPYVLIEYVRNQGPDDYGAMTHTGFALKAKYGDAPGSQYQNVLQRFDREADGSGTYRFRYKCGDQSGVILTHYNKASRQFDRDEILPDK